MFARSLLLIFFIIGLVFTYLAIEVDSSWAPYIIPFVILLSVIWTFSPQINWWYYKRNPLEIDEPIQIILDKHLAFYNRLDADDKTKFNIRLSEFVRSRDWTPMGLESIPEDIKAIIGASAIMLTFDKETDYLFEDYEKIIVYRSSFKSPHYKKYLHSSEINFSDKCILLSMQHLVTAFKDEGQYYDIALHEFSKAYMEKYPEDRPSYDEDTIWQKIEDLSNYNPQSVETFVGLELDDISPVIFNCIYHFDRGFLK